MAMKSRITRPALGFIAFLGLWVPAVALAQVSELDLQSQAASHHLEVVAGSGVAVPARSDTSSNQSTGLNVAASALFHMGAGWAVGVGSEWTRLPWTTRMGTGAHVDTWIVGPELRYTYHQGRMEPQAYLGLGWGGISPSQSSCDHVSGGPAARAGLGLDMQLTRRWQIGVSAGVVMQTIATSECISTGGDTGAPAAPGNIWALRIGGRGEFL